MTDYVKMNCLCIIGRSCVYNKRRFVMHSNVLSQVFSRDAVGGFLGVISDEIDEHLTLNDPPTHTLNFT